MNFSHFELLPDIVQGLSDAGYMEATPLQQEVLPHALNGSNLLVRARSGQGKDGAFIVPTLSKLATSGNDGIGALILTASPPRVSKIDELFWVAGYHANISSAQLVFKGDREMQEQALSNQVPVLISNPRYFADLCKANKVNLSNLKMLVLDELDVLLNEGDAKHLYHIIESISSTDYQVLAFAERSARSMEKVMAKSCKKQLSTIGFERFNPVELETEPIKRQDDPQSTSQQENTAKHNQITPSQSVKRENPEKVVKNTEEPLDAFKIPSDVKQAYIRVPSRMKITTLTALVEEKAVGRLAVFTASKRGSDRLFRVFKSQQRQVVRVNGRQSDEELNEMLYRFNQKEADLILISEINPMHLELLEIDYLVHYDVPDQYAEYTHRVKSISNKAPFNTVALVSDNDTDSILRMKDSQSNVVQEWPLPERAQKKFEEKKTRAAKGEERPPQKKARSKRPPRQQQQDKRYDKPNNKNSNSRPKRRKRTEASKLTELPKADFGALDKSRDKAAAKSSKGVLGFFKKLFR